LPKVCWLPFFGT